MVSTFRTAQKLRQYRLALARRDVLALEIAREPLSTLRASEWFNRLRLNTPRCEQQPVCTSDGAFAISYHNDPLALTISCRLHLLELAPTLDEFVASIGEQLRNDACRLQAVRRRIATLTAHNIQHPALELKANVLRSRLRPAFIPPDPNHHL